MGVGSGAVLGFDSLIGIAEESAFGTFVTATTFVEFDSESIAKTIDYQKQNSIVGRRGFHRRVEGQSTVEGDVTYNFNAENGLLFLKNVMAGSVTTVSPSGATHTSHTLELGDWSTQTAPAALSIQKRVGANQTFAIRGARVNQMVISGSINNPVKATVSLVAQDMSTTAASNAALDFNSVVPFLFFHGTYTSDVTTSSYGTTEEDIVSFELTINNNIVTDDNGRKIGSKFLRNLTPGQREINLTLAQRFDTTTAFDRWLAASFQSIRLHLDTGVTIGSATGNTTASLQFNMTRMFIDEGAVPVIADTGIVVHNLVWSGLTVDTANTTTSNELQVVMFASLAAL